ncbi:YhdT family protein [Ectobacillus sp. JY-23]|uniref:YhdT family protein n=1 Tax=Ectobacillus sp. JY-23 TaxID=2933872 RepID=UPI001FF6E9DB|nr:YhdT family protein [Ectobacillus sp. JY-23]UOY93192.1 YhdT family protein [Ectobacillus sp. JY-23]
MKETKDPRFRIAHREAWIGLGLAVINFIWWFSFAYGMGTKAPQDYTYVWGLPAWFFWSCIVGFIVMVVLVIGAVRFLFTDIPFESEGES